jgi:P27 family predicted phage terminase small subunit
MRGRIPRATADKLLRGNPGRRPLNSSEPDVQLVKVLPRPPKDLGRIGAAKWRSKGKELIAAGLLTALDLDALKRFCRWYEISVKASKKMDLDQLGGIQSTNLLNAYSMASKAMRQLEQEFGMTPASRSRVKVVNPKQEDLFGRFLNGFSDLDADEDPSAGKTSASSAGVGDRPPGEENKWN